MDNDLATLINGWFQSSPLASFLGVSSITEAQDIFGGIGVPGMNSSEGSDNPFADIFGDVGIPGLDTSPDGVTPFDGTIDANLFVNWNPLTDGSPFTTEDDGLLGTIGVNPFTGSSDPLTGEQTNPFIPVPGEGITVPVDNAYLLRDGMGNWYVSTDGAIGSDDLTLGASTPIDIFTSNNFFGQENPFIGVASPFTSSSTLV